MNRLADTDGGPPRGVLNLAKAQVQAGDEVTIFPSSSSGGRMLVEPGSYNGLTILDPLKRSRAIFPSGKVKRFLMSITREFDIIHIHGSWRYHLIAACKAAQRWGVPYIVRPAGNLGRIPRGTKRWIKAPYFMFVEKPFFEAADAIHCCTNKELYELEEIGLIPRHFVIPLPVDDSLLGVEPDTDAVEQMCPGLLSDDLLIVYLGRLAWIKRLPLLVESFIGISEKYEKCHLVLAGPWEDREVVDEINGLVAKADIRKRVHLPGMVRGEKKAALLRRTTIFVQPSSHENFGVSVAEALLFGKACITSSGVGLSDDVANAKAGLVFDDGVGQLTKALVKMLSDGVFVDGCAKNAKALSESFRPNEVAKKLKQQYNLIINQHLE
jgi:glycosyltransferase involved in cell wall biosynthesis